MAQRLLNFESIAHLLLAFVLILIDTQLPRIADPWSIRQVHAALVAGAVCMAILGASRTRHIPDDDSLARFAAHLVVAAWLGMATAFLWELLPNGLTSRPHSSSDDSILGGLEVFLAAIGLTAALVTGFYLVVLNRAQQQASDAARKLEQEGERFVSQATQQVRELTDRTEAIIADSRANLARVQSLATEQIGLLSNRTEAVVAESRINLGRVERFIAGGDDLATAALGIHVSLVNEVVFPLTGFITRLLAENGREDLRKDYVDWLKPRAEHLRVQAALFELARSPDGTEFMRAWQDVAANRVMLKRTSIRALVRLSARRAEHLARTAGNSSLSEQLSHVAMDLDAIAD